MLVLSLSLALAADTYDLAGPTLDAADAPEAEPLRNAETENGVPSAVGLGAFGFTACSGSLITPRIVLSAAHCGGDVHQPGVIGHHAGGQRHKIDSLADFGLPGEVDTAMAGGTVYLCGRFRVLR